MNIKICLIIISIKDIKTGELAIAINTDDTKNLLPCVTFDQNNKHKNIVDIVEKFTHVDVDWAVVQKSNFEIYDNTIYLSYQLRLPYDTSLLNNLQWCSLFDLPKYTTIDNKHFVQMIQEALSK